MFVLSMMAKYARPRQVRSDLAALGPAGIGPVPPFIRRYQSYREARGVLVAVRLLSVDKKQVEHRGATIAVGIEVFATPRIECFV